MVAELRLQYQLPPTRDVSRPTGPCADAPAPLSPGLAEAGGEYGCGAVGSGQRERRQGTGSLGSGLNDPWVAEGSDPWGKV